MLWKELSHCLHAAILTVGQFESQYLVHFLSCSLLTCLESSRIWPNILAPFTLTGDSEEAPDLDLAHLDRCDIWGVN